MTIFEKDELVSPMSSAREEVKLQSL